MLPGLSELGGCPVVEAAVGPVVVGVDERADHRAGLDERLELLEQHIGGVSLLFVLVPHGAGECAPGGRGGSSASVALQPRRPRPTQRSLGRRLLPPRRQRLLLGTVRAALLRGRHPGPPRLAGAVPQGDERAQRRPRQPQPSHHPGRRRPRLHQPDVHRLQHERRRSQHHPRARSVRRPAVVGAARRRSVGGTSTGRAAATAAAPPHPPAAPTRGPPSRAPETRA